MAKKKDEIDGILALFDVDELSNAIKASGLSLMEEVGFLTEVMRCRSEETGHRLRAHHQLRQLLKEVAVANGLIGKAQVTGQNGDQQYVITSHRVVGRMNGRSNDAGQDFFQRYEPRRISDGGSEDSGGVSGFGSGETGGGVPVRPGLPGTNSTDQGVEGGSGGGPGGDGGEYQEDPFGPENGPEH